MTNFLYEMQDELFSLNISVSSSSWKIIRKLIDHIEAQGKQLRELNKAIVKKNETIANCENEMNTQRMYIRNLAEKVQELNNGIRDSEDLSRVEKINMLEEENEKLKKEIIKCNSLKNHIAQKDIAIKCMSIEDIKKLEKRCRDAEKSLENSVIRCNNLEHNYAEEVKMKEQFKTACFEHKRTIAKLKGKLISISQLANEINDVLESKE